MQMEALECGAACLAMVLAYYQKWVPLEQLRVDCGVSRDGSNALNALKAARSYGLDAKGYRLEPEALRIEGEFPCIVHWNFNHFVVLCGFRGKYAYINDPARGSVKITAEEFDQSFTGICLMFEPTEGFQPDGKRQSTLSFARKRLTGAGAAVVFVMVTTLISYLFGIINPVFSRFFMCFLCFSRFFMDWLLEGENRELLMPFLILLAGVGGLQILVSAIQEVYALKINGKMAVIGSSTYMWKVLHLPMSFFSQRMAGDIQMRQDTNAAIAGALVNTLAPLLLNVVMMVFYLVVMLRYSVVLTMVGLATIVINGFMSRIISQKRVNITRVQMRDAGKLAAATVSVYLTMQGRFTLGMIFTFQAFLSSFLNPAMMMISAGQTIQEMRTQMERVEDVMQVPDDIPYREEALSEDCDFRKLSGAIELKHVTFGYSPLSEPLIKDFSMSIKPGSRVAFAGMSGSGKSSLAKLIAGLYQPWSGEILFDGKPIREIDRNVFTGSLAVVDQDIILFEGTVADNIKMWDDSIEDFEMILAARDAQIHEDIVQREGGYQGRIAEGGKDLSGGQRQRLEIARVLAQDPSIIIMDEATSALDAKTEYELVKSVKERGITCIVIAHRLSTIRDCDEIIVLDHGRVAERGTHDELYAKGGYYTELVTSD